MWFIILNFCYFLDVGVVFEVVKNTSFLMESGLFVMPLLA
ncbi:hypothetical protein VVMO6_03489 [Vibrio vulnificus MO6-24/O]|nr:hypothetical protein VVMO6_03489 [Vibrio vulnificus MO6-24/O]